MLKATISVNSDTDSEQVLLRTRQLAEEHGLEPTTADMLVKNVRVVLDDFVPRARESKSVGISLRASKTIEHAQYRITVEVLENALKRPNKRFTRFLGF